MSEALEGLVCRLRASPVLVRSDQEPVVVTGTGFSGPDRAAVRELARLCGFCYDGDLTRGRTTHLVVLGHAMHSDKRAKALEWGVPVVSLAWLQDSVCRAAWQPVQPYLLQGRPAQHKRLQLQALGVAGPTGTPCL